MPIELTTAVVTIKGTAPYSQSHKHDDEKLEGERPEDYDKRTWRSKMNVQPTGKQKKGADGKMVPEYTMIIPAFGIHMALIEAARYSKRQIQGQGKATWTAKIRSGVAMMSPGILNVDPDSVTIPTVLNVHADGKRGSGARVTRRFPQIPAGWEATFEVTILDPIITEVVFTEVVELAGLFIGVGQFRPENSGSNGRFQIKDIKWIDNRTLVRRAA